MITARRKMKRNQIKSIRKKQRIEKRSRNNQGPYDNSENSMAYHVDIKLETMKDKKLNY